MDVDELDRTATNCKKINANAFFPGAHNGLVAGSSPAGPTTHSVNCMYFLEMRKLPRRRGLCAARFGGDLPAADPKLGVAQARNLVGLPTTTRG
ncbi:MAG: hypothetical protein AB7F49_07720 [Pseudorhodoplanes sp.]